VERRGSGEAVAGVELEVQEAEVVTGGGTQDTAADDGSKLVGGMVVIVDKGLGKEDSGRGLPDHQRKP
jgi:hypothetical protein